MRERTEDKLLCRIYKAFLTAVMLCAVAMSAAAPDIAFAHGGGGGGGGHDEEPGQQETTQEDKETAKNKQKLFWAKQKMSKALNKLIRHQEYMKKKINSPETYNYSSEQLAADMSEEEKLQKEFAARQEEVKKLCSDMDVKPPAEAMLTEPDVFTDADSTAARNLQPEKLSFANFETQTANLVVGTKDTDTGGVKPLGSGVIQAQSSLPLWDQTYNPLDYDYGDELLDD